MCVRGPALPFLRGSNVNQAFISGCLFPEHHSIMESVFALTALADESTPVELLDGSSCLLHTCLNLPLSIPPTYTTHGQAHMQARIGSHTQILTPMHADLYSHTHIYIVPTAVTPSISLKSMCSLL